jgi:hypothetical protein
MGSSANHTCRKGSFDRVSFEGQPLSRQGLAYLSIGPPQPNEQKPPEGGFFRLVGTTYTRREQPYDRAFFAVRKTQWASADRGE